MYSSVRLATTLALLMPSCLATSASASRPNKASAGCVHWKCPKAGMPSALRLRLTVLADVPQRYGGSVGLHLSVPIYDGRQRRLEHDRIALREQSRQAYRTFYLDQLTQRHQQFREALRRADALLADLQTQSTEEERLIALYRLELERGLVRLTDLFLVLNNHAATVSALILSEADRARIINDLIHLK